MPTNDEDNQRENHRYLANLALGGGRKLEFHRRLLFPMVVLALFVAALHVLFPSPPSTLVMPALFLVTVGYLLSAAWRMRRRMLKALQSPGPEALLAVATKTSSPGMPDSDAWLAQARALAFAVYGRPTEARHALSQIDWSSRAPLIHAQGHFSEAWIALLCDRNIKRARKLIQEARARASISSKLPGATTAKQTYEIALVVCEILSGQSPPGATELLEDAVANHVSPYTRLLAAMGLAQLMETLGNAARAEQLRRYVAETAPHCAPLRLRAADFSSTGSDDPADLSIPTAKSGLPRYNAKSALAKRLRKILLLWVGLILTFLLIWQFLGPPEPSKVQSNDTDDAPASTTDPTPGTKRPTD